MIARDWQGAQRAYVRDGRVSRSLKPLVQRPLRLDEEGVRVAWGFPPAQRSAAREANAARKGTAAHEEAAARERAAARAGAARPTIVQGVAEAPCAQIEASSEDLREVLLEAVAALPEGTLALGGGVDAALILAILRCELDRPAPRVVTLRTGLAAYDEVDDARSIARSLGAECEVIDAPPETLVALLPEAIARIETPLYNLHPVGRLALPREQLITGDGADAACRGAPDLDSTPLLCALANVASPYFSPRVIAALMGACRERRDKAPLRALLQRYGVSIGPKRPRSLPPLDLSRYPLPRETFGERDETRLKTLALCLRHLEAD